MKLRLIIISLLTFMSINVSAQMYISTNFRQYGMWDEENEVFEYDIISDVGNTYLMIYDTRRENVRFIYEREENLYMVQHTIKKVWFEEED